jgi:fructokinase
MILVIGEALIDLIGSADSEDDYRAVVGGANANVALALARRDQPQQFLGRISTDGFGQKIYRHLKSSGVNLDLAVRAAEQTTLAIATLDAAGIASYSFYASGTADWGWQEDELPSLERLLAMGVTAIQFGCLSMAIEPGNLVIENWLLGLYQAQAFTLSHDLNIRAAVGLEKVVELQRVKRINAQSHIIKASDADMQWLFDLPIGTDLDQICFDWAKDTKLVVITRGAQGASLYRDGKRIDVASPRVQLVDTVGAGDTFMANLLGELAVLNGLGGPAEHRLGRLSDQHLRNAASFATVAAGMVCERAGCEPPTIKQVQSRLGELASQRNLSLENGFPS